MNDIKKNHTISGKIYFEELCLKGEIAIMYLKTLLMKTNFIFAFAFASW
jgi:hypothetical protein